MTEPLVAPRRTECVRCAGAVGVRGYGFKRHGGKKMSAHRVAFLEAYGYLPPAVRHTCDNGWCINPEHLVPGTQADNVRDRVERGRSATGSRNGSAKLTAEQVKEVRERYAAGGTSHRKLGTEYGVHHETIRAVLTGRTWA